VFPKNGAVTGIVTVKMGAMNWNVSIMDLGIVPRDTLSALMSLAWIPNEAVCIIGSQFFQQKSGFCN